MTQVRTKKNKRKNKYAANTCTLRRPEEKDYLHVSNMVKTLNTSLEANIYKPIKSSQDMHVSLC